MQKIFKKSEIYGVIFSIITGTLLHFLYSWSNYNPVVGIFAPYNESVWEHLKLLFFPVLFYSIFQYLWIGKTLRCFFTGKLIGILIGMLFITSIFCAYFSIIGHSVLWFDILLFFTSVMLCFRISYIFNLKSRCPKYIDIISVLLLLALFMCFYLFTFLPPRSFLFLG